VTDGPLCEFNLTPTVIGGILYWPIRGMIPTSLFVIAKATVSVVTVDTRARLGIPSAVGTNSMVNPRMRNSASESNVLSAAGQPSGP
jgi:hypothetical protein